MVRLDRNGRKGAVLVLLVLALMILLGSAAMTIDVGRIFIAAERTQSVADAAALAAVPVLGNGPAVEQAVLASVRVNNESPGGFKVQCQGLNARGEPDVTLYGPGSTLPDGTVVTGPLTSGVTVTCHIYAPHTFAHIYGADGAMVTRRATVLKGAMGGGLCTPMWIAATTPVVEGQTQNVFMGHTGIPGNFGWLDIPREADMRWYDIISGEPFTTATREALTFGLGDVVDGLTGVAVGRWQHALRERIERAALAPWTGQTWNNCAPDNPRVMLIPMVTYLGESGTNALYRIERFTAFWLEGTTTGGAAGSVKVITGRFIHYETSGIVAPDLGPPSAIAYGLYG